MLQRTASTASSPGIPRRAILLWATVISLALGAVEFFLPFEDALRVGRNALHMHSASGEIVIVAIDDKSLETVEQWPWRGELYAGIVEALAKAKVTEILFENDLSGISAARGAASLRSAMMAFPGRIALPVRTVSDSATGRPVTIMPATSLRGVGERVNANLSYNRDNVVWKLPYVSASTKTEYQSLSSRLARVEGEAGDVFRADYSTEVDTIPTVSAVDLLQGRVDPKLLRGKSIVVGLTASQLSQLYAVPSHRRMPAVYVHVLGAETLKRARPLDLGWLPPLALALMCAMAQLYSRQRVLARLTIPAGALTLLGLAAWLDLRLVTIEIMPSLAFLAFVGGLHAWTTFRRSYRVRGMTNIVTGLPNLTALRDDVRDMKATLIAARVQNFAEITAALPADSEKALVRQIVARLALGTRGQKIYQGDDGVFVWLGLDDDTSLDDQLEALHALCRTPVSVAGANVDLVVSFGIDGGLERSVANRVGGALVAADEAAAEGHHWKRFDAAKLKDSAWKLSLLGRLDTAIDSGEIWVAYQPKFDLSNRRIVGAEALVRWSHAEKGEIGPADFIPAAEQHNRIDKLTAHVLEDGVRTAADMRRADGDFDIAVNLSARLLDRPDLVDRVHALLVKYDLPSRCLTLEVTESAAMTGHDRSLETLEALRGLGVNISIDDYGTGFSTLDYLKRIPANEIKIDRSFVKMIDRSQSDRLLVESTIHLAHSLGRRVVAEGVETMEVLRALEAMGCDKAQGFLLAKPMPVRQLSRLMFADRRKTAA